MTIGALGFLSPWLLLGLLALPIIYWLLRTVPPRPRQVAFPPTRILVGLENKEKTPAKTPWWLMLIRLAAAALVILALSEPVLNPNREAAIRGSGPLVLVVDNTWAAAARWSERTRMLERLIGEAEAQERPVVVLPTASTTKGTSLRIEAPQAARTTAAAIQPQPFAPARLQAAEALSSAMAGERGASVVWLTDGLDHDGSAGVFAEALAGLGTAGFSVFEVGDGDEAMGVAAALGGGGRLVGRVVRAGGGAREGVLHAYSPRGQRLGEAVFHMAPGETEAKASFELPLELRNQVTRIEIGGERSAGAVHLLDGRSQWHRVGLISGETSEQAQPLLAPLYYIRRALDPFAELVEPKDANLAAGIDTVLKRNSSVVI
ncbi:MAG TPA: BatA domain-containing protein, partial [Hyphomicrobiaceae bacterium]|nr:BatA domain-containing protein [Hyphomicrobiaceae bacterium]